MTESNQKPEHIATKAEPTTELPLKGFYGGKPVRFVIDYDDHSSRSIGNADGSVDLIVANLTNRERDEIAMVEAMATALNDSKEMENQGFSYNERLAKICFKALAPYLSSPKPESVSQSNKQQIIEEMAEAVDLELKIRGFMALNKERWQILLAPAYAIAEKRLTASNGGNEGDAAIGNDAEYRLRALDATCDTRTSPTINPRDCPDCGLTTRGGVHRCEANTTAQSDDEAFEKYWGDDDYLYRDAAEHTWQSACRHKDAQHQQKAREIKELFINLLCDLELIKAERVNLHPMFWVKIEQHMALAKELIRQHFGVEGV